MGSQGDSGGTMRSKWRFRGSQNCLRGFHERFRVSPEAPESRELWTLQKDSESERVVPESLMGF